VYVARSVFGRETELDDLDTSLASYYDLVIVLRLSGPARRLLARTSYRAARTYLVPLLRYSLQLIRRPVTEARQLSELNFEVFGKPGKNVRHLRVDDALDLSGAPSVPGWPGRTVVVHTGSGSRFYKWPLQKWHTLLKNLHELGDVSFVFVGGGDEERRSFEALATRASFTLHSVIGRYDLLQVLMLMRVSALFVGVDSGPRHLAHLVDLPSVSLLGPGPKSFQPLNYNATVIDETECKKCFTLYCPHSPNCIEKIEVARVAAVCRNILLSRASRPA
jgi:ADP-heptose:LPS heptosyltransferase